MTPAETTVLSAGIASATPVRPGRIVAFDYLRGFVIVLVVLHHSVLAYCHYSHFDRRHYLWSSAPVVNGPGWLGFDILVLFNDSFFMPLMFLLSGLFVWTSLVRKGPGAYVRDRLLRLGLPFAIAVLTVVPLAYYPSFRMTGADVDFAGFWVQTVFSGPWPSGPAWFLGVLLAFDLAAVLIYWLVPRAVGPVSGPVPLSALACFGLLVGLSAIAYLPLLTLFGPAHWFAFGPLAVQASRVGLYALYFFAGVEAGRRGIGRSLLAPDGLLQHHWGRWASASVLLFALVLGVQIVRLTGSLVLPSSVWLGLYRLTLVVFCAATCFALLAIFLRFGQRSAGVWDSLAANAYGIYLLHYPVVIWAQYAMLDAELNVILKAAAVFAVALSLSWGSVIILRRMPGVARVI